MKQFCCCGTQYGYTHRPNCPYPCFEEDEDKINEWTDAYYELTKTSYRWKHLTQQQEE